MIYPCIVFLRISRLIENEYIIVDSIPHYPFTIYNFIESYWFYTAIFSYSLIFKVTGTAVKYYQSFFFHRINYIKGPSPTDYIVQNKSPLNSGPKITTKLGLQPNPNHRNPSATGTSRCSRAQI